MPVVQFHADVVSIKGFPMFTADATEFTFILDTTATVPCQTEMSIFGKFIRVLLFDVLSVSIEYVFPVSVALGCP